jgi:hypothetical protein
VTKERQIALMYVGLGVPVDEAGVFSGEYSEEIHGWRPRDEWSSRVPKEGGPARRIAQSKSILKNEMKGAAVQENEEAGQLRKANRALGEGEGRRRERDTV